MGAMLHALAHRGAAREGSCSFENRHGGGYRVMLGVRGSEPLYDPAAGVAVLLDGEIVNRAQLGEELRLHGYAFHGGSDAQLLARAYQYWDKEVVGHLRGPFAAAIWDARKERLLIARDRFGERPLYLHEQAGGLYFASEIKALLKLPGLEPKVDLRAVWDVLAFGYALSPKTLFAGIRKLMPGTYGVWQFGKLREARYWIPPDRVPRVQRRVAGDPVEAFLSALDEVVKLHMTGEQGAPGLFLSGGVDSAVLLALMSRHGTPVRTFCVGAEGGRASELRRAARVAKHFGALHHELVPTHQELASSLAALVAQRDAPVPDPGDLAIHALGREAARSVQCVLTGTGGDELLGGYPRHLAARLGWGTPGLHGSVRRARAERERLSILDLNGEDILDGRPPFDADPRDSGLRRSLYFDQTSPLPDTLLERDDRLALGTRAPFLDHRLAEQVSALPDSARVRGLSTKWILRRAARRLAPGSLAGRSRRLSVPSGAWLRGDMRDLLLDHLRGAGSLTRAYYRAPVLDRMLDEHLSGKQNHEKSLWTLLNIEIWHRTYRVSA